MGSDGAGCFSVPNYFGSAGDFQSAIWERGRFPCSQVSRPRSASLHWERGRPARKNMMSDTICAA